MVFLQQHTWVWPWIPSPQDLTDNQAVQILPVTTWTCGDPGQGNQAGGHTRIRRTCGQGNPQAEVVEGPLHTRWASRLRGTPSAPAPRHGGPCSPCRPQQTCSCGGGGERQTRCPTAPGSGGQGRVGGLHDPLNQTGQSLADTHEGSAPTAPCQVLSLASAKDAWRARRCQNQSHTPNVNHTAKSAGSCPEGEMDMSQALCRHPKPAPATR